jgi:hypothetical protein
MSLRLVWLDENTQVEWFTLRSMAVDAVRHVKVDGFGPQDAGRLLIFSAAQSDCFLGGYGTPLKMKYLRKGRQIARWRKTADNGPDFNRILSLGLLVNKAARR